MSRLPDWEDRLSDFLAANMARPFEWGQWDCILFATACAAEITGTDKAAAFRGQYIDREGAARTLRTIGQGTLLKTIDHHFERKPVGMAQRGDLVWAENAVGICAGSNGWFVGEEGSHQGLVRIPRGQWQRAWTV